MSVVSIFLLDVISAFGVDLEVLGVGLGLGLA